MLLDIEGLRSGYGRAEILHHIDLRVPAASAVALLGSNGAGKTTLLKTIAGTIRPMGGTIRLDGESIESSAPHQRADAGICLIPEGRGVFRRLSVRENITMQVRGNGVADAIERATGQFPVLGRRLTQLAGTLSGGEQQMLALSRALVRQPRLILADELSVGLAPLVVDEIFAAVRAMRADGCALIVVEQYVERAVALADYVYILQQGRMVFVGEPAQCASGAVFDTYLGGAA